MLMCSDITGVISLFELLFVVSSWPHVHSVISTGHHKNSRGDFGWGITNPLAHLGPYSHIYTTLYSNFHDLHTEILRPETDSLLAYPAQSSLAGYCIEKHITAEQFEFGQLGMQVL